MTGESVDVEALRKVAEAATPGPWRWSGNTDTGEPYLSGASMGLGRTSVLAIGYADRSTTGRAADEVRSYALDSGIDPDEAAADWALDRYDQPIKEPRLWFYRDHMAVDARKHVRFEVAPQATSREDPKVYRADITDVLLPDAQHIATFDPTTVLSLLDALAAATARAEAAEAREAALRAGVEALAPACWVYRSTEVTCTDLVGGELPNGATWVEDMCCLPCRLRALLATGGAE